jgi:hypothetical protein
MPENDRKIVSRGTKGKLGLQDEANYVYREMVTLRPAGHQLTVPRETVTSRAG